MGLSLTSLAARKSCSELIRSGPKLEYLAKTRLEEAPEETAPGHLVFPHAALALVDPHADRRAQRGAEVLDGLALFIEAVAGLMDRTEKCFERRMTRQTGSSSAYPPRRPRRRGGRIHRPDPGCSRNRSVR